MSEILQTKNKQSDRGESSWIDVVSRVGTIIVLAVAFISAVLAPIDAILWVRLPFPGFLIEHTLVVTNTNGPGWVGFTKDIGFPMRIIGLNSTEIHNETEYENFLENSRVGEYINVITLLPGGEITKFSSIELKYFSTNDFIRLFWLSYVVGLVYLIMGSLIYRARGGTSAGRAFSFFCGCAAIINILLFSIWSSHSGSAIWAMAVAMLGGALIGLAVLVPTEMQSFKQRSAIRTSAYLLSIFLAVIGLVFLNNPSDPWSYIVPWRLSYLYAAIGGLVFFTMMIVRLRSNLSPLVNQQVKIILWGGGLAFTPTVIWLGLQFFISFPFYPLYFSPFLLIFPLSITIAMLGYRLWDVDVLARRTLIYTILTLLLVGIYLSLIYILGEIFDPYFGQNHLFSTLATVVIVLVFGPIRKLVQKYVDRRVFRQRYLDNQRLSQFEQMLRMQLDVDQLNVEMDRVIGEIFNPQSYFLWIPKKKNKKRERGENV